MMNVHNNKNPRVVVVRKNTKNRTHAVQKNKQKEKKRRISSKGTRRENEGEEKEHIWRERH